MCIILISSKFKPAWHAGMPQASPVQTPDSHQTFTIYRYLCIDICDTTLHMSYIVYLYLLWVYSLQYELQGTVPGTVVWYFCFLRNRRISSTNHSFISWIHHSCCSTTRSLNSWIHNKHWLWYLFAAIQQEVLVAVLLRWEIWGEAPKPDLP